MVLKNAESKVTCSGTKDSPQQSDSVIHPVDCGVTGAAIHTVVVRETGK